MDFLSLEFRSYRLSLPFPVLPQPIYMNSEALKKGNHQDDLDCTEEDLKTPTVEELAFPGHAKIAVSPLLRLYDILSTCTLPFEPLKLSHGQSFSACCPHFIVHSALVQTIYPL